MRFINSWLWAAVAACLLAGGVLLLLGCDFARPPFLSFDGSFCSKKIDLSGLKREHHRQDDLIGKIHEAELQLASLPDCPPPAPPPAPKPQPPPVPGPQVGKRGALEITLWWETRDDLDLFVNCPTGTIKPTNTETRGPGICGDGVLDVDANRTWSNATLSPREHVTWATDIPSNALGVDVQPNTSRSGDNPISFNVRVDYDGESKVCSGQTVWNGKEGYGQTIIEFTPAHPLPACTNINFSLHPCAGKPECTKR